MKTISEMFEDFKEHPGLPPQEAEQITGEMSKAAKRVLKSGEN